MRYQINLAQLNAIATRALIDNEFKIKILNGFSDTNIEEYLLPEKVIKEILNSRAENIGQFIVPETDKVDFFLQVGTDQIGVQAVRHHF